MKKVGLIVSFLFSMYGAHAQRVYIDSIRQALGVAVEDSQVARYLYDLNYGYMEVNTDSALYWADSCVHFSQKHGQFYYEVLCLADKAFSLLYAVGVSTQDGENALELAREAYFKAFETDHAHLKIMTSQMMGTLYSEMDSFLLANEYWQNAIDLSKEAHNDRILRNIHNNRAGMYYYLGQYERAYEDVLQALRYAEITAPERTFEYKKNLALLLKDMNRYEEAIQYLREAREEAAEVGADYSLAFLWEVQTSLYTALANQYPDSTYLDSARWANQQVLKYDISGVANLRHNQIIHQAEIFELDQKPDSALFTYQDALDHAKKFGLPKGLRLPVMADIIKLNQELGRWGPAQQMALKMYEEVDLDSDFSNGTRVTRLLAGIYEQAGNHKRANQYWKAYISMKDSMIHDETFLNMEKIKFRYALEQKEAEKAAVIDKYELQLNVQQLQTQRNRLVIWGLLAVLAVISQFSFLLYRSRQGKTRANQLLEEKSGALKQLNVQLKTANVTLKENMQLVRRQNEALAKQKSELEKAHHLILKQKFRIEKNLDQQNRKLATYLLKEKSQESFLHGLDEALQNIAFSHEMEEKDRQAVAEARSRIANMLKQKDSWEQFKTQFEEVHPDFFSGLLQAHPDLSQTDLKYCAYIRLGMGNQEMASAFNLTLRGIEAAKSRLRKKMDLSKGANLTAYLITFARQEV